VTAASSIACLPASTPAQEDSRAVRLTDRPLHRSEEAQLPRRPGEAMRRQAAASGALTDRD
jgi:hypothetical protein